VPTDEACFVDVPLVFYYAFRPHRSFERGPFTGFHVICIGSCGRDCNSYCGGHRAFVHRTSHLGNRMLFLLVALALTCLTASPAFYVAIVENEPGRWSISRVYCTDFATLHFKIMPSGDWSKISSSHTQFKVIYDDQYFLLQKRPRFQGGEKGTQMQNPIG
jgi:hypothetical protein